MFIYDLEIENPIPPKDGVLLPEIKYSKGWDYPATMGIACICVYEYTTDTVRTFGEYEMEAFQRLIDSHDVAVGFNNIKFDNAVLRTADITIDDKKCYDIFAEIQKQLGFVKGCRLDDCVKANFPSHAGKNGDGAMAPVLWQQGYKTRVIDYCQNDVRLTKMLLDRILRFGFIYDPTDKSKQLRLRRP